MKRLGKILGWVFAGLAVVLAAGITFTIGWRPFTGPRTRALTARSCEAGRLVSTFLHNSLLGVLLASSC